jgi:RND family efflux transporter MFP subunit
VTTLPLASVLEQAHHSAPASVVARDMPTVAAEVSARVTSVPVDVGDRVDTGEPLARLDCGRFDARHAAATATLARAEASARFATRQLQRARDLRRNKSVSEELLDQRETETNTARSDVDGARAALEQAGLDVDACTARAPVAGIVTARHASVGDYVTPGSPLVGLVADDTMEVSVALRLEQIEDFRAAPEFAFSTGDRRYPLSLRTVVPVVDDIGRTREARLVFTEARAMPGSPGRVTWTGATPLLPAKYLVRRNERLGVMLADGSRARFVALPSALEGRPAPVLLPGDSLLIEQGRQRLGDGDPIHIDSPGTVDE